MQRETGTGGGRLLSRQVLDRSVSYWRGHTAPRILPRTTISPIRSRSRGRYAATPRLPELVKIQTVVRARILTRLVPNREVLLAITGVGRRRSSRARPFSRKERSILAGCVKIDHVAP